MIEAGSCLSGERIIRNVAGLLAQWLFLANSKIEFVLRVKDREVSPGAFHTLSTKLSTTRFSPALSKAIVSLLPSTATTLPLPNFW